jgi:hypothetical protein
MADAALLGLAGTIVGGAIAVVSGWLGPWVIEGRKEKAELKKRRADKFEEMVGAVYEFDHWLDTARGRALGGITSEPTVSPFAKIQAIAAAYFPDFDPLIRDLDRKTNDYRAWIETAAFERVSGRLKELPDGFIEVLNPYTDARDKLMDELKRFTHTSFQ